MAHKRSAKLSPNFWEALPPRASGRPAHDELGHSASRQARQTAGHDFGMLATAPLLLQGSRYEAFVGTSFHALICLIED